MSTPRSKAAAMDSDDSAEVEGAKAASVNWDEGVVGESCFVVSSGRE